jgi:methionyl aminopeptidase
MRDSCFLARDILQAVGEFSKEGITTDAIDDFVHEMTIRNNAYPSTLTYRGFPKSVCTSVNNVACHGIPDDRPLHDGDIINIDVTVSMYSICFCSESHIYFICIVRGCIIPINKPLH